MNSKTLITTGEAQTISGLSRNTIIRLFDRGELGGFTLPGGTRRRISVESLRKAMKQAGMPMDAFEREYPERKSV
jgi:excisionase family DNA binding protein